MHELLLNQPIEVLPSVDQKLIEAGPAYVLLTEEEAEEAEAAFELRLQELLKYSKETLENTRPELIKAERRAVPGGPYFKRLANFFTGAGKKQNANKTRRGAKKKRKSRKHRKSQLQTKWKIKKNKKTKRTKKTKKK
jgi:hypothetical protein